MNVRCPQCETLYRVDPSRVPERGVRARCAACASVMTVRRPRDSAAEASRPPRLKERVDTAPVEREVAVKAPAAKPKPPKPEREPEPAIAEAVIPEPFIPVPEPEPVIPDLEPQPEVPPPELAPQRREAPRVATPRYSRPFIQPRPTSDTPVKEAPPAPPRPTAPVFRPTPGTPVQPHPSTRSPAAAPPRVPQAPTTAGPIQPTAAERRKPINPFLSRDPSQKARRLARALVSDMIVYQPKKRQEALQSGTLKEAFGEEIKKSWEEYVQQVGEDTAQSTDFFREALNDILAGGRKVFEAGFKF